MRQHRSEVKTPILLLERDGYQVFTILVGKWNTYLAWTLVRRDEHGGLFEVATGWTKDHEEARASAYEAYMKHRAYCRCVGVTGD